MTLDINRRAFIKSSATTVAALCASTALPSFGAEQATGNTSAESARLKPALRTPQNAGDSHIHIMDVRFPAAPGSVIGAGMGVTSYRKVQAQLGTQRVVIVQPKVYGTDNDCILDAVSQFGGEARGIAVIEPTINEQALTALNAGSIRGVRFSVWNAKDAVVSIDMLEPVARRIREYGWHIQLHMQGDQIVEHEALLKRLQVPIVFDHMGRLTPELGAKHPAFKIICDLIHADRAWVKLAGAYLNTRTGAPYDDATEIAKAFVQQAPERLVWGSDWPHTTEKEKKPNDSGLLDLLLKWAPNEQTRSKILVTNPSTLYGFI